MLLFTLAERYTGPNASGNPLVDEVAAQQKYVGSREEKNRADHPDSNALIQHKAQQAPSLLSQSLIRRKEARAVKPDYHPQWRLMRVISGHLGWVRSVAVEPGNQWFATGAGDRVIKVRSLRALMGEV